ncbi:MAG: cytochrome c biogenesis protein CcsA [Bacteroidota bacterium]
MKHTYKVLGVLILLYSFTAGMLVPLSPGIQQATPTSIRTNQTVDIAVTGYNTYYESGAESLRAWLKLNNELALAAEEVMVDSETAATLRFQIPAYLPSRERVQEMALVMDNAVDGASVLPNAVFVTQDSINPAEGEKVWQNSSIESLHDRAGMTFPFRNILGESIRNTYFHVSLWFAMIFMLGAAVWQSVAYLRKKSFERDNKAVSFTQVGVLFGILGVATGAVWANYTWGAPWSWDIKQNTTAVALLIYFAYFILRNSFDDQEQKARIAAVYSIFAFVSMILLLYVIPRLSDSSLHPGNGGNPAFGGEDLDNTMRMIFYPAIIGWTLFGTWLANVIIRAKRLEEQQMETLEMELEA